MSQNNPANSRACAKYYEKNKEVMKEKMMGYYIKTRDEVNEKKANDPEFCKLMKEKYRLKNEKHKHTIIKKSLEDLIELDQGKHLADEQAHEFKHPNIMDIEKALA